MIEMKKKILIGLICFISGILIACGTTTYASQDKPLKIWYENGNGNMHTYKVVDEDTGVNYVVVEGNTGGGHRGVTMCPRYNSDGTLYISK